MFVVGIVGVGAILLTLFSSPVEKLTNKVKQIRYKRKQRRIEERQEANKPILDELNVLRQESQENDRQLNERIDTIDERLDEVQGTIQVLVESDKEQLRQWMDAIYYQRLEKKEISQHNFERFRALYESYKSEGGNGQYEQKWREVQTWKKVNHD